MRKFFYKIWPLILILGIGLAIRLALLPAAGYRFDLATFIAWAEAMREHGVTSIYDNRISAELSQPNYPPLFLYILWVMTKIFGSLNAITVKLPAIIFDVATAIIIWYAGRKENKSTQAIMVAVFFLNPAVWLISAFWGQIEVIYVLFVFLALFTAYRKRFLLASVAIVIAFSTEIQAVVFFPLLIALCYFARRSLVKSIVVGFAVLLIIISPFIFSNNLNDLYRPFLGMIQMYPFLTVNAMNYWWAMTHGALVLDSTPIFGLPAIYFGLFFFVLAVAGGIIYIRRFHELPDIFFVASVIAASFFFFSTDMHERYLYPVFLLLPLALPAYRMGWIILGLFSVSFIANILYVLPDLAAFYAGLAGVSRFFLVDCWWIVTGIALVIMYATMYYRMRERKYVPTTDHLSGL